MSLDLKAVRAWGVANGRCAVTGKLPLAVVDAYKEAHGIEDELDPPADPIPGSDEWDVYVDQCVKQLVEAVNERAEIRIRAELLRVIGGE